MIIKGIISNIHNSNYVRIIIPSKDSKVSYSLELAQHIDINALNVGDRVIAAFYC